MATGIVLASFYCAILSTDINRIENFREPVFTIARNEEAGATEYKGLGYKTIVKYGHTENNEKKINSIEMFMLGKCIAGAIE